MRKEFKINKKRLGKKIGHIIKTEKDFYNTEFKNIVVGFVGQDRVLIKTNMNQNQFDSFALGELTKEELHRII